MILKDGHPTRIFVWSLDGTSKTTLNAKEISVTPVSYSGGGEIDQTTMQNTDWRTSAPRSLFTADQIAFTAAYDTDLINQLFSLVNDNRIYELVFPDNTSVRVYGWLDESSISEHSEGERPTAEFTVIPSNMDHNDKERGPGQQMNYVLESIINGSIGQTTPDGFTSTITGGGDSGTSGIVASIDGSNDHQAWRGVQNSSAGRAYILQTGRPVFGGKKYILALYLDVINDAPDNDILNAIPSVLNATVLNDSQSVLSADDWKFIAFELDGEGQEDTIEVRFGLGVDAEENGASDIQLSRPLLMRAPDSLDVTNSANVRTFLDNNYLRTT